MASQYLDMGFNENLSNQAYNLFGDNIQEASTWLLRRSTMGQLPKRFKDGKSNSFEYTFYKSKLLYKDERFTVTSYDSRYNIIEIDNYMYGSQWVSISDPDIEWINEVHASKPRTTRVKFGWRRNIGTITINFRNAGYWPENIITDEISKKSFGKLFEKRNSPWFNNIHDDYETKTRKRLIYSVLKLTNPRDIDSRHQPDWSRPISSINQTRITREKKKLWNKFLLICAINHIDDAKVDFLSRIRHTTEMRQEIINLQQYYDDVDNEVCTDLISTWKKWVKPRDYLLKKIRKWERSCLSFIEVDNLSYDNVTGEVMFDIIINDKIFQKASQIISTKFCIHLRRIFEALYGAPEINWSDHVPYVLNDWKNLFLHRIHKSSRAYVQQFLDDNTPYNNYSSYKHQNIAINWMMNQENIKNSFGLYGWDKMEECDGFVWYRSQWGVIKLNQSAPDSIDASYPCRGGILAQSVGAGKTFEIIKLIQEQKKSFRVKGPTLIVVPTSIISIWTAELTKFASELTVNVYHGSRRVWKDSDIVITTYRILSNEFKTITSPLFQNGLWARIVCDEAHQLKVNTKTFKALKGLIAPIKWCVTATPFGKHLIDSTALLSFLNIYPFNKTNTRYSKLHNFLLWGEMDLPIGEYVIKMFENICLYQTKNDINKISNITPIELVEQNVILNNPYDNLYQALFNGIKKRIEIADGDINHSKIMSYIHFLRICSFHPSYVRQEFFGMPIEKERGGLISAKINPASFKTDNDKYNQNIQKNIKDYMENGASCSICLDTVQKPTMTKCGHLYCFECINDAFQNMNNHKCPICRENLEDSVLYELEEDSNKKMENCQTLANIDPIIKQNYQDVWGTDSPKIKFIQEMLELNPEKKYVIFTSMRPIMHELRIFLETENINYAEINGSMTIKKRAKAIESFQTNPACKVFILSMKCASVGITLTASSNIVFMEPIVSNTKKIQAIGRIQRLGQKENKCTVITLKMKDTIDEYIESNLGSNVWLKKYNLIS